MPNLAIALSLLFAGSVPAQTELAQSDNAPDHRPSYLVVP